MARALFFGRLRDAAGCSERQASLSGAVNLQEFRARAADGDADFESALQAPSIRVALNGAIVQAGADVLINPGDEVAFMPPFSGG
jgi:molybdopterin synthase sulfur carrier subunit